MYLGGAVTQQGGYAEILDDYMLGLDRALRGAAEGIERAGRQPGLMRLVRALVEEASCIESLRTAPDVEAWATAIQRLGTANGETFGARLVTLPRNSGPG